MQGDRKPGAIKRSDWRPACLGSQTRCIALGALRPDGAAMPLFRTEPSNFLAREREGGWRPARISAVPPAAGTCDRASVAKMISALPEDTWHLSHGEPIRLCGSRPVQLLLFLPGLPLPLGLPLEHLEIALHHRAVLFAQMGRRRQFSVDLPRDLTG